jgi:hypothetical protein
MHYTDKTHFFRDAEDNRVTVRTTLVSDSQQADKYEARIIEGQHAERDVCGKGPSRFAAIADLVDRLGLEAS